MDRTHIIVEKRSDDYRAYIKYNKAIWGCGKTINAAIGDLMSSHQDYFDLDIEYPQKKTSGA